MTLALRFLREARPRAARGAVFGLALALAILVAACARAPGHEPRTLEQLTTMAENGDAGAQTALGQAYERGLGLRQNVDQALRWYRRASAAGDAFAPFQIGALYERGRGVPQDFAEAAHWYRIAAERGNDAAQASLAYLYEQGLGVPRSYAEAVRWYEAAEGQWRRRAEYPIEAAFATGRAGADYVPPPADVYSWALTQAEATGEGAEAEARKAAGAGGEAPTAPEPALGAGERGTGALESTAPRPAESAPGAPPGGEIAVHLASFRTAEAAVREWDRLRAFYGALFDGLDPLLAGVELGAEGGFVRLLAAPFPNLAAARAFCDELARNNHFCKISIR